MIVITCSNLDDNVKLLKAKWPNNNALLLSVNDLTSPGWEVSSQDFSQSKFVAEETIWPVTDIEGIINLLPAIAPYELFKIVEEDRDYVASELNAFLFYFLSKMKCPFLNKLSMFNLSGPFIKPEEWIMECRKAGIPVCLKLENNTGFYQPAHAIYTVSYLNGIIYNNEYVLYEKGIRKLAENTGLNHFAIRFIKEENSSYFHSITTYPNVNDDEGINRLVNYFQK